MENSYKDYVKSESRKTDIKIGFIIGATLLLAAFAIGVGLGFIEIGANGLNFVF